jgi:hypothetical protein
VKLCVFLVALCVTAISQSYAKNHSVAQRDFGIRINKNNPLHIKIRFSQVKGDYLKLFNYTQRIKKLSFQKVFAMASVFF